VGGVCGDYGNMLFLQIILKTKKKMAFWLINPKNKGSNTDLTGVSHDSVYMGWGEEESPKFYYKVKKGDIIIVASGAHIKTKIHYIGIADSLKGNCWHLKHSTKEKNEEISTIIRNNPDDFGGHNSSNPWGPLKSIIPLTENPAEKEIKKILNKFFMEKQTDERVMGYINLLNTNKNLILTGAPGTGKTYLAKQIAQQMIFGEVKEHLTNEEQKQYDEQCGFVQFHPSYDYTDFVEGLRPKRDDDGDVGFERKDGFFKVFCKKALQQSTNQHSLTATEKHFDESWQKLLDYVRENIAKGKLTKIGIWEYGLSSADSLKYTSLDTPSKYTFTINKKNVFDAYRGLKARPSGYFQKYIEDVVKYMSDKFGLRPYKKSQDSMKGQSNRPYIFIIDEINRGEISKIFGELFFSIDPGYRGGKDKVDTQYQNLIEEDDEFYDGFFVPDNVYIIGTMNDIDRSVESMDFAFRRRFAFKEIKAEDGVAMLDDLQWKEDAIERMKKLNTAIEKIEGLSSAYHIGPAYFLKLKNYNGDFDQLWEYHIEGLLFEYMRGMMGVNAKLKALANAYGYSKANNYDQPSNN
jgi:hypothetical protein